MLPIEDFESWQSFLSASLGLHPILSTLSISLRPYSPPPLFTDLDSSVTLVLSYGRQAEDFLFVTTKFLFVDVKAAGV